MKALITATTQSKEAEITVPSDQYITVVADGLTAAETVSIGIRVGTSVVPLKEGGAPIQLDAATNIIQISGPATFGVAKSVTAAAVTVWVGV